MHDMQEFIAGGVIIICLVKLHPENTKHTRTMFVRKMRGTDATLSNFKFDIVSGKGIVVRERVSFCERAEIVPCVI